ncbi:MAG: hypothetical protein ACR2FY_21915 [Pirellulaceae bacterium]
MNDDQEDQRLNPYASPQPAEALDQTAGPPASFSGIVATGFRLYRRNFVSIAVVTLFVWCPIEFIESYCEYFVFEADDIGAVFRLNSLMEGLFGIIAYASVIAIGMGDLRGQPISTLAALRQGISAWPRLFWTGIVSQFAVAIGLLFLLIPGVYLAVRFSLYYCVAVNEGLNGVPCLKRSMALTKDNFWGFLFLGIAGLTVLILLGAIAVIPLIVLPQFDNWITSAISNLIIDLLAPLLTLIYVAAYWSRVIALDGEVPAWSPPQRTTKVFVGPSSPASKWWEN